MLAYAVLLKQLDRLYFSPLAENESIEMRADAIEAFVHASGWTWDKLLAKMAEPEGN